MDCHVSLPSPLRLEDRSAVRDQQINGAQTTPAHPTTSLWGQLAVRDIQNLLSLRGVAQRRRGNPNVAMAVGHALRSMHDKKCHVSLPSSLRFEVRSPVCDQQINGAQKIPAHPMTAVVPK
jgi:hypothetical protein